MLTILPAKWDGSDAKSHESRREIQDRFNCCGYRTITDHVEVPCYSTTPCRDAVWSWVSRNIRPLGFVAVCLGGLQLVALLLTCVLIFRPPDHDAYFYDDHAGAGYHPPQSRAQYYTPVNSTRVEGVPHFSGSYQAAAPHDGASSSRTYGSYYASRV